MTDPTYTVYGVPKGDDMSDGEGRPMRGAIGISEEAAEAYIERNTSPDNNETYVMRRDGVEGLKDQFVVTLHYGDLISGSTPDAEAVAGMLAEGMTSREYADASVTAIPLEVG